jgi:hypothetical protein
MSDAAAFVTLRTLASKLVSVHKGDRLALLG